MSRFRKNQRVILKVSLYQKVRFFLACGLWPPRGGRIVGWRDDYLAWEFKYRLGTFLAVDERLEAE